ncbi:DUF1433 domain-containing protein [Alkalihalobacillus hwajinpoensis]|uniref:DUF1433 domain-containing protein n=1 Tax=Guptibacillus hwajinpoensis TaxID=208199 RepID=UPI0018846B59|nr:DUF1433 domain-containing protein [Pseudalkalibacillus hwajinpoensis]MBF0707686.1 DUF1433 domain-containing protein [Pseudalkalibacillus hwajinpoensis]
MLRRLFLVFPILFVLGGCSWGSSQETYDEETIAKAESSTLNYIKSNFKKIQSVEITNVYQNEMGGMTVEGSVNNGEGTFSAGIENDFSVGSVGVSETFPDRKEDCMERTCTYEH